jgi:Zn finger protein HypA/HybF involved in hydrogenase expression
MSKVIDFQAFRPHLVGKATCLACSHEWTAVAPIGTLWLECPECTLERGRLIAQCQRDEPHWHCDCGNELFYVTADGYYCPNCGLYQKGF